MTSNGPSEQSELNIKQGDTALLLNIGDMIDMAIGTPEVGVVDFNLLQTVLHVLAQQTRLLDKRVELRGNVPAPPPAGRDTFQTINVTEYIIESKGDEDASLDTPKLIKTSEMPAMVPYKEASNDVNVEPKDTLLVVERVVKMETSVVASKVGETGVTAPQPMAPELLSLVTVSKFKELEELVAELKSHVYGTLDNKEILEQVKSQANAKSITDMWTSLNVSSRLTAVETALSKLSAIVQELITQCKFGNEGDDKEDGTDAQPQDQAEGQIDELEEAKKAGCERSGGQPCGMPQVPEDEREDHPAEVIIGEPQFGKEHENAFAYDPARLPPVTLQNLPVYIHQLQHDIHVLHNMFLCFFGDPTVPSEPEPEAPAPTAGQPCATGPCNLVTRFCELEKKVEICCDNMGNKDSNFSEKMSIFEDQLCSLAKQLAAVAGTKLEIPQELKDVMQLYDMVQKMHTQLHEVVDTAAKLVAEKEERQHHISVLLEQIEILKSIKMDREDMEEAMAAKADLGLVAKKVSREHFQLACDDLAGGLGLALSKLNAQETLWQQALDDIQREIENKLDRLEMSPLKELFESKLRQLQERLKQIAALHQEPDAAGAKKRLRDMNCISCDAQASMKMEVEDTVMPLTKPMTYTNSVRPYITYELDTLRKQQANPLPQRNLHDWEKIEKQLHQNRIRTGADKHLCNRYCGGSHTMISPAQRVSRAGHFVKQWGPEVQPLPSTVVVGDDNRPYKGSATKGGFGDTGSPKGMISADKAKKSICECSED